MVNPTQTQHKTMSALTHSDNSFLPPPLASWSLASLGGNGAFPQHIITTTNSTHGHGILNEESERIQNHQNQQSTRNTIDLTDDDVPYYFPDSDMDSNDDNDDFNDDTNGGNTHLSINNQNQPNQHNVVVSRNLKISFDNENLKKKMNKNNKHLSVHCCNVTTHLDQLCSGEDMKPQWRRQEPYLMFYVADGHSGRECVDVMEQNSMLKII